MERLEATYLIETSLDVQKVVAVLAGEQSCGTFVAVPGETDALRQRFAARVEQIELLETCEEPSLPSDRNSSVGHPGSVNPGSANSGSEYQRAKVVISWPVENFGYNLPAIISTVQGNLYELRQLSGLKLLDLQFPDSFAEHYQGPRFGIEGTRKLANVYERPLIGTIIKPSVGMSPQETAQLVRGLLRAGIDFIKDDELMASPVHSPFNQRVEAIMREINEHADQTGKKAIYAFNISDELDQMLEHYEAVETHGGKCVMMSLNSLGIAAVKKVCDQGRLAVHGHRNGWGMLTRHPLLGIEFTAYQKLWRLAGVDQIHVNGIQNKFWESDDSVVRSIQACHQPFLEGPRVLPVVSSGQWGGQASETYRRTQSVDLLYLAGGGILAHPDGMQAGVTAIREAWDLAAAGYTFEQAVTQSEALRRAAEKFSNSLSPQLVTAQADVIGSNE